MKKYLIIGGNGQLGTDLRKVFPDDELVSLTHSEIEVTDFSDVTNKISKVKPEIVINTSAYHRVDDIEADKGNFEKARAVNAHAVENLAKVCREINSVLVHFSTDYVFDGEKGEPYLESDKPNPINLYGETKLEGEQLLRKTWEKYFLLRVSGLFGVAGSSGKGGNFIETMLKLAKEKPLVKVVDDQVLSPTYTKHIAKKVFELVQTEKFGLYHVSSKDWCSWYDFADEIFNISGIKPKEFLPQSTEESGAIAKRPKFSSLAHPKRRLNEVGLDDMPTWQEGLQDYFKERGVK